MTERTNEEAYEISKDERMLMNRGAKISKKPVQKQTLEERIFLAMPQEPLVSGRTLYLKSVESARDDKGAEYMVVRYKLN